MLTTQLLAQGIFNQTTTNLFIEFCIKFHNLTKT